MADSKEGYWSKHHTGIIQCVFGLYDCVLATFAYFAPRRSSSSVISGGGQMSASYTMPWYLWIGIIGLALSVMIPAIVMMFTKEKKKKKRKAAIESAFDGMAKECTEIADQARRAGAQARLLMHFEAEGRQLERFLIEVADKWRYAGENLIHPISESAKDWKEFGKDSSLSMTSLRRDFMGIYSNHFAYVRLEFPGLETPVVKLGYPSEADFHTVMFAIKDHCQILEAKAKSICETDNPIEEIDAKT